MVKESFPKKVISYLTCMLDGWDTGNAFHVGYFCDVPYERCSLPMFHMKGDPFSLIANILSSLRIGADAV